MDPDRLTQINTRVQQATAAQIGAAIRRRMGDPQWSWRYTDAADPIEARAIARLRSDRDRAARWLELAAEAIGMPLPVGNGSGGPWQRAIVLDTAARVGLIDIAAGRIAWTDACAPSYVRRFAVGAHAAQSPHQAGGSGSLGARAVSQVTLIYGMRGAERPRLSPVPRPSVTEIEWGLRTCYGSCGDAPTAGEYRREWASLVAAGVPCCETTAPQWAEVDFGKGVDPDLWGRLIGSRNHVETRPGNWTVAGVCRHYVSVYGDRATRARLAAELTAQWGAALALGALRHAESLLDQTGHATTTVSGARATGDAGWHQYGPQAVIDRLRMLAPQIDPAIIARRDELAARVLAEDPAQHGLSRRDPWGRPGEPYPDLCEAAYGVPYRELDSTWAREWSAHPYTDSMERHILEAPGVTQWIRMAREAAESERRRIGLLSGAAGPVTDQELELLIAAGYTVVREAHGHVHCDGGAP